jgi:threonine aldolase
MTRGRGFGSDNQSGIHPEVLAAIIAANEGHVSAYGDDPFTAEAVATVRRTLGVDADVYFVPNGTGANVVGLASVMRPFEAVICPAQAHVATDECGAPERFAGIKVITVPSPDGRIGPSAVEPLLGVRGVEHHAQPRVISTSQPTELGTSYRPAELRALADFAHAHGLLLHVDGARLYNAAAFLGTSLRAQSSEAGVDVLSLGGTKLGLAYGEAVVLFGAARSAEVRFVRKQASQLLSKMRFVAAQFDALLRGDLWRRLATHANAKAARLGTEAGRVPGVRLTQPVEANEIFATIPAHWIEPLRQDYPFYVWNEARSEVRWVCSWDTSDEDVTGLVARLEALARAR